VTGYQLVQQQQMTAVQSINAVILGQFTPNSPPNYNTSVAAIPNYTASVTADTYNNVYDVALFDYNLNLLARCVQLPYSSFSPSTGTIDSGSLVIGQFSSLSIALGSTGGNISIIVGDPNSSYYISSVSTQSICYQYFTTKSTWNPSLF
jgi:hypothetical protein